MIPPLLVIDVSFKGYDGKGLFDPGSNISLLSKKFIDNNTIQNFFPLNLRFQTLSGAQDILGISLVKLTISSISSVVLLYVVDSLKFDVVLGLDTIPIFHLSLDDTLNISQSVGAQDKHIIFSPMVQPSNTPNVNSTDLNNLRVPQELLTSKLSHLNDEQQNLL